MISSVCYIYDVIAFVFEIFSLASEPPLLLGSFQLSKQTS